MREFRCTRPTVYQSPRCPGHADPSARQGHYVQCATVAEAHAEMKQRFPKDSYFEAVLWKEEV